MILARPQKGKETVQIYLKNVEEGEQKTWAVSSAFWYSETDID